MNMYKIYLKQAWALLKENKLLSGVSIFGTALAICMIMVIVIVWQIRTANYSPEDYRDRCCPHKLERFTRWAAFFYAPRERA